VSILRKAQRTDLAAKKAAAADEPPMRFLNFRFVRVGEKPTASELGATG
jgi:hypothetical protein